MVGGGVADKDSGIKGRAVIVKHTRLLTWKPYDDTAVGRVRN